ncbi:MAG TPA: succinate dehydrogenase, cytochrome b556 subunit [Alphaproteobacteria bacterium]
MPIAPEAPSAPKPILAPARPLSPHLQVYRPQLTSVLSITHRATGVALAVGTLLLVWWLIAAATGPEAFAVVQSFMGSWLGLLLLLGWTASLFFHLSNGIRHLFWDAGLGFELKTTYRSGWAVVVATVVLTVLAWLWGLA